MDGGWWVVPTASDPSTPTLHICGRGGWAAVGFISVRRNDGGRTRGFHWKEGGGGVAPRPAGTRRDGRGRGPRPPRSPGPLDAVRTCDPPHRQREPAVAVREGAPDQRSSFAIRGGAPRGAVL